MARLRIAPQPRDPIEARLTRLTNQQTERIAAEEARQEAVAKLIARRQLEIDNLRGQLEHMDADR